MILVPDGADAHRAVNLSRLLQGLPAVGVPPVATTVTSADTVEIGCRSGWIYFLLWHRGAGALGPDHVAMVWALPRVTMPSRRRENARYVWCGCVPISVEDPVRIEGLLMGRPVIVRGGVLSLLVGIAETGLSPFCRIRACLRL